MPSMADAHAKTSATSLARAASNGEGLAVIQSVFVCKKKPCMG
uniref:Uncharacterized protein n=1 Tax=Arundo donax TaxID=35708 RepID=A0A0A8YKS4_ARUDO